MKNNDILAEVEAHILSNYNRLYFDKWEFTNVPLKQFFYDIHELQKDYQTMDVVTLKLQCYSYRARSLRDRFLLANYYYNCSLKEFLQAAKTYELIGHRCGEADAIIIGVASQHPGWILSPSFNFNSHELKGYTGQQLLDAA